MMNICLIVSYDGTSFCGWQRQLGQRSVEQLLAAALQTMHRRKVPLYAAGRTDSGVHAHAQTVNFQSDLKLPPSRFVEALNSLLPHEIRVLTSQIVAAQFHARYSAVARIYHYRILNQPHADAQLYRRSWYVRQPLSLNALNSCIRPILGKHDFTTFAAAGSQSSNSIRTISAANFFADGHCLVLRIVGNAFLWHMVRSLVGTCVDLVRKGQAYRLAELLLACDRRRAGLTAPAQGLTLEQVVYSDEVFPL